MTEEKEDNTTTPYPFFFQEGEQLQLIATDFNNGLFIAISELGANKLGTMALSLPIDTSLGISAERRRDDSQRRGLTSATVIGSRNEIYTKALAEKVAIATKKMIYLSTNFQEQNEALFSEASKLIDALIEEFYKT